MNQKKKNDISSSDPISRWWCDQGLKIFPLNGFCFGGLLPLQEVMIMRRKTAKSNTAKQNKALFRCLKFCFFSLEPIESDKLGGWSWYWLMETCNHHWMSLYCSIFGFLCFILTINWGRKYFWQREWTSLIASPERLALFLFSIPSHFRTLISTTVRIKELHFDLHKFAKHIIIQRSSASGY